MIVLGADTHKSSHTIAAVDTATGQVLDDKTIPVGSRGFGALVLWARGLDGERVWAFEDCRHVSGALERFLIARGERVVRVSTRLMAGTRRSNLTLSRARLAQSWPKRPGGIRRAMRRARRARAGNVVVCGPLTSAVADRRSRRGGLSGRRSRV